MPNNRKRPPPSAAPSRPAKKLATFRSAKLNALQLRQLSEALGKSKTGWQKTASLCNGTCEEYCLCTKKSRLTVDCYEYSEKARFRVVECFTGRTVPSTCSEGDNYLEEEIETVSTTESILNSENVYHALNKSIVLYDDMHRVQRLFESYQEKKVKTATVAPSQPEAPTSCPAQSKATLQESSTVEQPTAPNVLSTTSGDTFTVDSLLGGLQNASTGLHAAKESIVKLDGVSKENRKDIKGLKATASEHDGDIKDLKKTTGEHDDDIKDLKQQVATAQKDVAEMKKANEARRKNEPAIQPRNLAFGGHSPGMDKAGTSVVAITPFRESTNAKAILKTPSSTASTVPGATPKTSSGKENALSKKAVAKYIKKGSDNLNNPLRFGGGIWDSEDKLQHIRMQKTIAALPPYVGTTYRAVNLLQKDLRLVNYLKSKKGPFSDRGWMSSSSVFFDHQKTNQFKVMDCRFTIHGKTGRDISKFAGSNMKDEMEVIYFPGTTFKVLDWEEELGGQRLHFILEETDPSPLLLEQLELIGK